MLLKAAAICLCFAMPTAVMAELTRDECAQIKNLLEKTPLECLVIVSTALPSQGGAPTGTVWQNHIFFSGGGSALDTDAIAKLHSLRSVLQGDVLGAACIQLIGHSDSTGGSVANQRIGQLRAEKVASYLGALLSDSSRVQDSRSFGEAQPLSDRPTTDKWQRRVEIRARACRH